MVAIRQRIKVLSGNISLVNEWAAILSINSMTKSTWQINKTQDFLNFSAILCARLKFPYFFCWIPISYQKEHNSTFKCITGQIPTKRCLFKIEFVKYQFKVIQRRFSLWVNFLLTLILQLLMPHFFVTLLCVWREVTINVTLSHVLTPLSTNILLEKLKETRNSYFCLTPKIRCFTSLHHVSSNNSKNTN